MNIFKYIFLIGAILAGIGASIAMLWYEEALIWAIATWALYILAYALLVPVMEDYGVGPGYTVWIGGVVFGVALYVLMVGELWSEILSTGQRFALPIIGLGVLLLATGQPQKR